MSENNPSIVRTLEQQGAAHAWQQIQLAMNTAKQKELKSLARSAPASIQSSGLGQTVAFWKSKFKEKPDKEDAHFRAIYKALDEWLSLRMNISETLIKWIALQADSTQYRQATAEALAYLSWYKRFAEAELKGGSNQ
uniref:CRISPR type III-B/RAMP module-associated protein Cmr5 n=1 Tax=Bellilinea caldifistulae TaxID=360411 RepID=A0A7C4L2N9_9CHLR